MTRNDLSTVPPQGGYVAKQCPVRAQNNVLRPCAPLPVSPELQRRFDQGREFEGSAVERLEEVSAGVVVAAAETGSELEALTEEAMESRVSVIVGGRLPTDHVGKRVGKPDLLVVTDNGGFRPVDVKHHMALAPAEDDRRGLPALCSSLANPRLEDATVDDQFRTNSAKAIFSSSPTTSGCSKVPVWPRPVGGGAGSWARSSASFGTTSMLQCGKRRLRPASRRCGPRWSDTTSSSSFGSTLSPWPMPICATRRSSSSSCRSPSTSARSVHGAITAVRNSSPEPATSASSRGSAGANGGFTSPTEYVIVLSSRDSTSVPLDSSPLA